MLLSARPGAVYALFPVLCLLSPGHSSSSSRPLLLFLIDGFRADYMRTVEKQPGFRELLQRGVTVDYMTPDFPSLSYPNYYSLMTGRHCDAHHMTGNYMWDERSGSEFLIGLNADSRLPLWWEGAEPLWVTAQRRGKSVHMYYWPGCEVEILGVRPAFCEEYVYNPSLQNLTDSIDKALTGLSSGQVHMAAVYWEKVDVEGHHFGPDSAEVRTAVLELDGAMQLLSRGIQERGLQDSLNVLLFSDHGMTNIQWMEKVIEVDKHIDMADVRKMLDRGPVVSLWPQESRLQQVYNALSVVPHMKVYMKAEVPARFFYSGGKFVSPLTLVAEPGWFICQNKSLLPFWANESSGPARGWQNGWHGYDNEFADMRGFFVAAGPDFRQKAVGAPIRSVDVYNLMCRALALDPLPNNGSWSRVEQLLSGASERGRERGLSWALLLCTALLTSLINTGP